MNIRLKILISLSLVAVNLLLLDHVRAQTSDPHHAGPAGHHHESSVAHSVSAGSVKEAWEKAQAALTAMQKAAAAEQAQPIHDEQEKLAALLQLLQKKAATTDDARLKGAINNTIAASEKVHAAADANDFASVTTSLRTLAATMSFLEKQVTPLFGASFNSVKAELTAPARLHADEKAAAVLRLTTEDGKPLTLDLLEIAHTEKLHLLIIDQTLTDYHHEHPVAGAKPGEYQFDFTPHHGGTYFIWADVVPTATGQQEYAHTQVQVHGPPPSPDKTLNTIASSDGLKFSLTTEADADLQAGQGTVVHVAVTTSDGKKFQQLEPVMGAFAHMVAFPDDLGSVMHVHPMGKEPQSPNERGGPQLSFHVEPEQAGFHKFFLQVQVDGKQVFAAFGQKVQPASTTSAAPPAASATYVCPMHPEVVRDQAGQCPKCGMSLIQR